MRSERTTRQCHDRGAYPTLARQTRSLSRQLGLQFCGRRHEGSGIEGEIGDGLGGGRILGSSLRIDRFFQRGRWEGDLQIEVERHRSRAGHNSGGEQVRQAWVRWRLRDPAAFT